MMLSYEYVRETRSDRLVDYKRGIDAVDVQAAIIANASRVPASAGGIAGKVTLLAINQFVDACEFSRLHVVLQKALHAEIGAGWVAFAQSLNEHLEERASSQPNPDFVQRQSAWADRRPLFLALDNLARLKTDWAGAGSSPPSKPVLDAACSFARLLQPNITSPQVTASGDGDVAFVWLMPGRKIEVIIDSDLVLAWVVKIPPHRASDAAPWNQAIPSALRDWLRNAHT